MIGRIIEVQNSHYLSVKNGFLVVTDADTCVGKVPLDDIAALILSGPNTTLSVHLINRLHDHHAIIVLTDAQYLPANIIWPINHFHQIGARLKCQLALPIVLKKQLWKQIVYEKLLRQKQILDTLYSKTMDFQTIINNLRSGDSTNQEAVGAKKYWPLLFGPDFRRSDATNPINHRLNYGYTVLRSLIARSVAASGLNPALGIHHKNETNAFCLVDDLMEPYRPFIDYYVYRTDNTIGTLTPTLKKHMVDYIYTNFQCANQFSPLPNCIHKTIFSYVNSLESKQVELVFPRLTICDDS